MMPFLLATTIITSAVMAIVAHETDNDAVLWGMFGFLLPPLALLFIPGLLDGRITRAMGSDH